MNNASQILDEIYALFRFFIPEFILAVTLLVVVILSFRKRLWWMLPHITAITGILIAIFVMLTNQETVVTNWFLVTVNSLKWRIVLDICLVVIFLFQTNRHLKHRSAEFVVISLMILIGAHFLVVSNHLFMVYLSIEIMSLSAYMLVALPLFKKQVNAGFKYLVFGAVSSGLMLYGISLLYGMYGTLSLPELQGNITDWPVEVTWLVYLLILVGLLFKIGAVPLHLWVPDVYQSASIPVLTILSTLPKIAAMIFLIRWYHYLPESIWVISVLAMVTIGLGNLGALRQDHIRRLLGFSAIAHSGFMLAGVILSESNPAYLEFYIVIYALMTLGIFHSMNHYELTYGAENISDLAGGLKASSWKTIRIVIWMIALTGLPPTAGFTAKLFLFSGLAELWTVTSSQVILVVLVFGILNAVISLAFYLRIPYQLIFRQSVSRLWMDEKIWTKENFLGTLLVLGVLILFFKPEWLMGWINSVSFVP